MKLRLLLLLLSGYFHSLTAQTNPFLHLLKELPEHRVKSNFPVFRGPTNSPLEDALDMAFDSIANISPLKGFNAAINLPDGSVWRRAKGLAHSEPLDSLSTSHAMGMGSTTKTFTAVTMLLLHEEGLVNINNPISDYLPDFQYIDPDITIRQLLQHTSGIYSYTDNPAFSDMVFSDPEYIWSPSEILETFVLQSTIPAGTDWSYSNTNYLLAGMIIESVTNQNYYTVVRNKILNPLGLTHTFCYPQESLAGPFADVWLDIDGNGTKEAVQDYIPLSGYFSAAYSAGALVTTPEDIALFFKKLLNQEILQASTYNDMFFLYPLEPSGVYGYGLGIYNSFSCNQMGWGHNGYIIYQSDNITLPNEQVSIAVLSNDGDSDPEIVGVDNMIASLEEVICNFQPVSNENVSIGKMSILPNPVANMLTIEMPVEDTYKYSIADITGKIIHNGKFEGNIDRFNTQQLVSGIYLLQVISEKGIHFQQNFIKVNRY